MTKQIQVTIGVPTYKRPELLRRCLKSILKQSYENIEVIIGDNDFEGFDSEKVFREHEDKFKSITYKKHASNIGPTENMMYLLSQASGPYFMWLADDDELSGERYVQTLVEILQENPDAVTAVAQWKVMSCPDFGEFQPHRDYSSRYWFLRVLKFIWRADDDFFYGLHRKEFLKKARVGKYWRLNAEVASNLTYTFLIDLVIAGRILRTKNKDICWVCHAYTFKNHTPKVVGRTINLKFVVRRINVHWIYVTRIFEKGGFLTAAICLFASLSALIFEAYLILMIYVKARLACFRDA